MPVVVVQSHLEMMPPSIRKTNTIRISKDSFVFVENLTIHIPKRKSLTLCVSLLIAGH